MFKTLLLNLEYLLFTFYVKKRYVGFMVADDLERCIEKINEAIKTVINVYDRIDSYTEKSQLAKLMWLTLRSVPMKFKMPN